MSAQPYVSAISVCGPAIRQGSRQDGIYGSSQRSHADFCLLQRERTAHPRLPDTNIQASREHLLPPTANFAPFPRISKPIPPSEPKYSQQMAANAEAEKPQHEPSKERKIQLQEPATERRSAEQESRAVGRKETQQPASADQRNSKRCTTVGPSKPPFLVGKPNNLRNHLTSQKHPANGTSCDNRSEVEELKRQIGELSQLLRLHVDTKSTKRDAGTDPIDMENGNKLDKATNTESCILCTNCKKRLDWSSSPPQAQESSDPNLSLCSQLESLAMQYLSDDQLANIAFGGEQESKKPCVEVQQRRQRNPDRYQASSPPRRQLAAMKTTTQSSSTFSPTFRASGELTLTRRHCVMTMEQQVSIFGRGVKGNETESIPFGVSVASKEFMQRHGVLKAGSSRPPVHQIRNRNMADIGRVDHYGGDRRYREPFIHDRHYSGRLQHRPESDFDFDDQWD